MKTTVVEVTVTKRYTVVVSGVPAESDLKEIASDYQRMSPVERDWTKRAKIVASYESPDL